MTKLTEEHKRKIGEGVKLSRRRFLQGAAATGIASTTGGQELITTRPKPSKVSLIREALSTGIDTSRLALNPSLTRRQFITQTLAKPLLRTPIRTLENISRTGKLYTRALGRVTDPIEAARATSGVKPSAMGKLVRIISRVIS